MINKLKITLLVLIIMLASMLQAQSLRYKFTDHTRKYHGTLLHQIQATSTFVLVTGKVIMPGTKGGYIESTSNLQDGWVDDQAIVKGHAVVSTGALVKDKAIISGNAVVEVGSIVEDSAKVSGHAIVTNHARIVGNARISGHSIITANTSSDNKNNNAPSDIKSNFLLPKNTTVIKIK